MKRILDITEWREELALSLFAPDLFLVSDRRVIGLMEDEHDTTILIPFVVAFAENRYDDDRSTLYVNKFNSIIKSKIISFCHKKDIHVEFEEKEENCVICRFFSID